jgi:FixJ family two-component response regulator
MKKRSLTIAIVDDDASLRKALRRLLRVSGYVAEAYASGPEFLASLKNTVPDGVVLDVRMTPIGGLEIHREIIRRRMRLPVIFISAGDDNVIRQRALKQGAVAYLQKPLPQQALLKALADILSTEAKA